MSTRQWAVTTALALLPLTAPAFDLTAGAGAAQNCPQSGDGVAFNAAAYAYLEPAPVITFDSYGGGRYDPAAGNNVGVAVGYAELSGAVGGGFCLGALYRAEYRAEASRDLLDGVISNHFSQPFDTGRHYALSLYENSFRAEGIRLRKVLTFNVLPDWTLKAGLGLSGLKGLQVQEQSGGGSATATSGDYAVGTAYWLRTESDLSMRDFNPFVAPGSPNGAGFSTDLELLLQSTSGWSADFVVMDLYGRIYWHEIPQELETFNNAIITYNQNLDRNALIQGRDSRVSPTQDLDQKYHFVLTTAPWKHVSAIVEDDFVDGLHFPAAGGQYGGQGWTAHTLYDVRTKGIEVGAKAWGIGVSVMENRFALRNATALGLSVQAEHTW